MKTDVLVIGSGIAGCSTAISAVKNDAEVTVVTKATRPDESSTKYAQGGIARVSPGDTEEEFKDDIIRAGHGESDTDAVSLLVEEGNRAVQELLIDEVGVEFDTIKGDFDYTIEAGHSSRRVLHIQDETGRGIEKALIRHVESLKDAEILEGHMALDLIVEDGRVYGAIISDLASGEKSIIQAGNTVLATGGIGKVYGDTTNPDFATGDGIAIAAFSGAEIKDMEYVQFHPTVHAERKYLLTESLRGEGAVLVDDDGERFMQGIHPDAELAPRDVVADAVHQKWEAGYTVYLDMSPITTDIDEFSERFPSAYSRMTREESESLRVPVKPAEHFLIGGVDVDEWGCSSVDSLYSAGETACTGVHGANRLASTSLLEGLVWGLRSGEHAAVNNPGIIDVTPTDLGASNTDLPKGFCDAKFEKLNKVMWRAAGVTRDIDALKEARLSLQRLRGEVKSYARGRVDPEVYELRNAVVVGLLIVEACLENPSSKGCHIITS